MSKIDECISDVVEACAAGNQAAAQARIDRYFGDLEAHLQVWTKQDGSREKNDLEDRLTAAATKAARDGHLQLSDRLERCLDYARKQARKR